MPTTSKTSCTTSALIDAKDWLGIASRVAADPGVLDEVLVTLEIQRERAQKAEKEIDWLKGQVAHLEHKLELMLHRMFGRRSEKLDPGQLLLFANEATPESVPAEPAPAEIETITYQRQRNGHSRGHFPANLPRQEIPVEPADDERVCTVCGQDCRRIRDEVTERGDFVPGSWRVLRYVRGVWACQDGCSVVTAELPPTVVPKSRFEPSVSVHTAVAKYGDHLPLERQAQMHRRLGVDVAPTTLGDAVQSLAELHRGTVQQMESEVLAEKHIHTDDTPVTAIIERDEAAIAAELARGVRKPKRKVRVTARMWVYVTLGNKIFYRFTEDRTRDGPGGPAETLREYLGTLICDEYSGFDAICDRPGMFRAGCWAHVRRKVKDALVSDPARATRLLLMIRRLFWIESAMKKRMASGRAFGLDDVLAVRHRRSRRIVAAILRYARTVRAKVLPQSIIGTAVFYILNNRKHLTTFLDDPLVPISNNAAERAVRAIAVGRKNYLFFGSLAGGDIAAVFYSLIGTCKALGINPSAYLMDTTKTLLARPDAPRSELTPWAWAESQAKRVVADLATAE